MPRLEPLISAEPFHEWIQDQKARGVSICECARILGITARTIHRWLNQSTLTLGAADRITTTLWIDPTEWWPTEFDDACNNVLESLAETG